MEILFRNSTHTSSKSHDCLIGVVGNIKNGGKKIKITYEAYNAVERCSTEVFDGDKWNHLLCMLDMGITPDSSAYIWNEVQRKKRADLLIKTAETMCTAILS